MATGLSDGYIYFLESDAVDNDDWIADHAGDPDSADISGMAEGTEYCKLKFPQRYKDNAYTGMVVTDAGGGSSFDFRSEKRGYNLLPESFVSSIANANLVHKFCMIPRHTSGLSATFHDYYMVVRRGASNYVEFINAAGTVIEYCPVRVLNVERTWDASTPQIMNVRLTVRSVM